MHTAWATDRRNWKPPTGKLVLESYLVAVTETWWYEFHDCIAIINGYRLLRRDRKGRRNGGIALYTKNWIECEELYLESSHEQVESSSVRIRD